MRNIIPSNNIVQNYSNTIQRPSNMVVSLQNNLQAMIQEIAQNLACIGVTGYKATRLQRDFVMQQNLKKDTVTYPVILNQSIDLTNGGVRKTENQLDVCIIGEGYLSLQTPNGKSYTRDGRFGVNKDGVLISTSNGCPVLSKAGSPIRLSDAEPSIDETGAIFDHGNYVGKLSIVKFDDPQNIISCGDNMYTTSQSPKESKNYEIIQGMLETSNVNPMKEMILMIELSQQYEYSQKLNQKIHETQKSIIQSGGK
jgi:flagellar basal-body rod protein FlgF